MTSAVPSEADCRAFVQQAYRAVLGRDPDPEGWQAYTAALREGRETHATLLQCLCDSEEYGQFGQRILGGLVSSAVAECSAAGLASIRSRERDLLPAIDAVGGGDTYIHFHRYRFAELLAATEQLLDRAGGSRVLDCGHLHSGLLLHHHFGERIALFDLNRDADHRDAAYLSGCFTLDLEADGLAYCQLPLAFDCILFTEMIEHLRVNPLRILEFLARQLAPCGRLLLSTPNFYNHHNLAAFRARRPMQPPVPYTMAYQDLHCHHVHEYCPVEILEAAAQVPLELEAFWFSDCWDRGHDGAPPAPDQIPTEALSNLVFVFRHPAA